LKFTLLHSKNTTQAAINAHFVPEMQQDKFQEYHLAVADYYFVLVLPAYGERKCIHLTDLTCGILLGAASYML